MARYVTVIIMSLIGIGFTALSAVTHNAVLYIFACAFVFAAVVEFFGWLSPRE